MGKKVVNPEKKPRNSMAAEARPRDNATTTKSVPVDASEFTVAADENDEDDGTHTSTDVCLRGNKKAVATL